MPSDDATARELRRSQKAIAHTLETISGVLGSLAALLQGDNVLKVVEHDPAKQHRELYGIFRDYLKHEDDLINNRLSWNFTIQGFLFAAYSFSIQKIGDIRLGLARGMDTQPQLLHSLFELQLLLVVLALAGINISGFVYLSVKAARIAICELEDRWYKLNPTWPQCPEFDGFSWMRRHFLRGKDTPCKTHGPELPGLVGGGHPAALWLGFHAPSGLPLSILGIWVILLIDASLDLLR